jgi:hypothetical protein
MRDPVYDILCKLGHTSVMLNDTCSKHYAASKHIAAHIIKVPFKGRIIFKRYFPKQHKYFRINIHKLRDKYGYICDMDIYLAKYRTHDDGNVPPTHKTVRHQTRKMHGHWNKLHIDNFMFITTLIKKKIVLHAQNSPAPTITTCKRQSYFQSRTADNLKETSSRDKLYM